jgi:Transposase DDE domain
VVTGSGWWYQSGRPLIPVRWVFVRDRTGTHRDEYFFTTDVTMSPKTVIETYTGRWNIETTFQEMRSYLGLETTRGWSRNTILRSGPCLFSLYTVVVWLYVELPARSTRVRGVDWLGKCDVTFSDAITAVRRWLWVEWVLELAGHREAFQKLSGPMRQMLLNGLAPAA